MLKMFSKQDRKAEENLAETIQETLKKSNEKKTVVDPHDTFKSNEILVGNYTFYRTDTSSDWTITEVSQVYSRNLVNFIMAVGRPLI